MNGSSAEIESDLIDLTDVTLEAIRTCDTDSFVSSSRRVLARIDKTENNISGYNGAGALRPGPDPASPDADLDLGR